MIILYYQPARSLPAFCTFLIIFLAYILLSTWFFQLRCLDFIIYIDVIFHQEQDVLYYLRQTCQLCTDLKSNIISTFSQTMWQGNWKHNTYQFQTIYWYIQLPVCLNIHECIMSLKWISTGQWAPKRVLNICEHLFIEEIPWGRVK